MILFVWRGEIKVQTLEFGIIELKYLISFYGDLSI